MLIPSRSRLQLGECKHWVERCNLTSYMLYNWCRSRHECVPSCRHLGILRLNRKLSIDIRRAIQFLTSFDLSWVQFHKLGFRASLCPSPAVVCVPFLHVALSPCCIHSLSRQVAMEKRWFTQYHGYESQRGTTENNERHLVDGFIL